MPDEFTAAVDAELLLRSLDHFGAHVGAWLDASCLETAKAIVAEASRRIHRQTGETAAKIHYERGRYGGYVVMAYDTGGKGKGGRTRQHHVDLYLEFGTTFMYPRPFLLESARLEEGPHMRRLEEAAQKAIDEEHL
jgi:hypothetical protein